MTTIARRLLIGAGALAAAVLTAAGASLAAQEQTFPGVRLGLAYEGGDGRPVVAIQPFFGRFGRVELAREAEAIVTRDLNYSDRFEIITPGGAARAPGESMDWAFWDELNVEYVVTAAVESGDGSSGARLVFEVRDAVYREVKGRSSIPLPSREEESFRMTVHLVSDQIVEWITGEPGMAASQIAFSIIDEENIQEIYLIDSDGERLTRLTRYENITMTPAWSRDARYLAYVSYKDGMPRIYEHDFLAGRIQEIAPGVDAQFFTPAYTPQGKIAFSLDATGLRTGLYTWDPRNRCCLQALAGATDGDLSPSYSPDGSRFVFNSGRLGEHIPQIYLMEASGRGQPGLVSPYEYTVQGYYSAPEWSPTGDRIVFSGRIGRTGFEQVLMAELGREGRLLQVTTTGRNEDPTWAPDGRHVAFIQTTNRGVFLVVKDLATGAERILVRNRELGPPAWSPRFRPGG